MRAKKLVGLSLVALLFDPALAEEHGDMNEVDDAEERICIDSRRVRNFDGLTDEYLFLEESGKKYYLVTMRFRCLGLRYAQGIALKDATSRICSGGFGEVVFRERGRGLQTCQMDTIERVENKDEARAIIEEREQYEKEMKAREKAEKKKAKEQEED